ncbi:TetR/AcrR family transcriptional regulator [Dyella tabacisoli]|uniref:TetR/AcrR family transcriptional regulator n=1 Tax=Dyella tabacisoli TaxID=2282381 RepID=A0A369UTR8_9GAMM|nr:TetR/AcrR family transcriptional regulator [Dyella tabacisoli]RDD81729.1 TetR/AcrR family transcriptional regulator [Dyella tabacisoli]
MNTQQVASKGEATRELILDSAYEIARNDGLEGLSLGLLAKQVGMSKSGVFAHFGSREELQLAVLEAGRRRFLDHVLLPAVKLPRGLPRLQAIVHNWFEWVHRYQSGCVLLAATSEYDGKNGALHDAVVYQQAGWRQAMIRAVDYAIANGELPAGTDAAQVAFEIHALALALHQDAGLFGYEDAIRRARRGVERLLGVAPKKADLIEGARS